MATPLPTFSMLAYSGRTMRVGGYQWPIAVDLSGMSAPRVVPIFRGHDPDRIVGHATPDIRANELRATGTISAGNAHAAEVVASGRNDFPWQASIGAVPAKIEFVREGETAAVNGRVIPGPALIARKSWLSEISFVPLGADNTTESKVN